MNIPILATKLYIPPSRSTFVLRSRLIERLNEGLHRKLTIISASAGFGKTTLVREWLTACGRPAAWLSLDKGDNDSTRFLTYFVAALQTISANIGEGLLGVMQSPQPPSTESILTALLNEITTIPDDFVLVLDDYHVIDTKLVDNALTFLIEYLPPNMHLVIATREDPHIPLARLRARAQLNELRITDLRFSNSEAAGFLNGVMGLNLSSEDIALLENRTEGWIAGLQLAAISLQGHKDSNNFIKSFTGSHHFVLDYLMEEVLLQQPESIQTFLLRTSILDRLCGPLCDAVLRISGLGQERLEYLEHANLFICPLDNERRWYRYHHLFADFLRQRLLQIISSSTGDEGLAELHIRASAWYEDNGLEIEALHHAVTANDVERAAILVEGKGMPLHYRGAVAPVLNWLESQPTTVLDARPSLWVMYTSALLFANRLTGIEKKFQAAEAALQSNELNDNIRDLVGHIAQLRATVAVSQHQVETIITQSSRALEYLHPNNLPVRNATMWALGYACYLQGDRVAAYQAYTEAITMSQKIGHNLINILATIGLGNIQEADNKLDLAAQTYRRVLQMAGDPPIPIACEAHIGLARIYYQWNDLDAALQHGQWSVQLARQVENTDRFICCEVFLARLKFAQGDVTGAAAALAEVGQSVRQYNFVHLIPEVAAAEVHILLQQGDLGAAAQLAQSHELPISQARVHMALGDMSSALALLGPLLEQLEAKGWEDERLKVMILQSIALQAHGEKKAATKLLIDALTLAEPGGFIRIFLDEGKPIAGLLSKAAAHGNMTDYIGKLLAVFIVDKQKNRDNSVLRPTPNVQPHIEPLSERELIVLQLIAQGLSNREISEQLFVALSTVKGHNQNIFAKLQVQRRTEALIRARELGLL
ncbi:LuxR C-terminal-related transcriptional regulator [Paenibacillus sp. LjRoot153]|uniref:LuxR C-terminal-related transcriptional regulator n=1 Tax=Paenibacillus sp. LjRoot153 TaxID=3342270 RepID=UPI003ECD4D28